MDIDPPAYTEWSDSDDDDAVEEGEYTGRFRTNSVPTKLDPPSSATRERMEDWSKTESIAADTPRIFQEIDGLDTVLLKADNARKSAGSSMVISTGQPGSVMTLVPQNVVIVSE
ncbi:hypothetical protein H0H92_006094 [Tricholoma furcatifolium]|nr:hypothetical protein H0H92_006094 [Tricholoma furcatifolium]